LPILVLVLLWDWNWFRPLVERQLSSALGRPVHLAHFDLKLGRYPQLLFDGVAVSNPDGFPAGSNMATIDHLAVRLEARELLHHHVNITQIDVQHPAAELGTAADGTPNWKLALEGGSTSATPSPWRVNIGGLSIENGKAHFLDPRLKSDFTLDIHTQPADAADADHEDRIYVGVQGRYAGQPVSGRFIGGSVLGLRQPENPYPVDLKLANGATGVSIRGTLLQPLSLGGADLRLELSGDDLAALYPLTGIPFAPTPPYKLAGHLDYAERKLRFRDFAGTVGNSDLEGEIDERPGGGRPYITAQLNSRRVVLADLAGFIGSAPGKEDNAQLSKKQVAEHARQDANPRLLPNIPINLPKLRSADLDVHYTAQHIDSSSTPLDDIKADLKIDNGTLTLHPLSFGVGQGRIVLNIRLEGKQDLVHTVADVDFRKVDLARIMQSTKLFKGAGTIGGSARLDASGNSLAQMLGHGDGELKLFMSGGDLSALLVDLAGLDFGNGVVSALGLPGQARLRCMVTDFGLDDGQLDTRTFVFDTTEANVVGTGKIDLRGENIDYKLSTEPKRFNIGHLRAPILIRGPLKNPSVLPDPVQLGARGGAAVLLGILATPLAALLPTIELGLGKDHNCEELMQSVHAAASKQTH
jgi:uncharacterized protein involved in outer membrane biogenesis